METKKKATKKAEKNKEISVTVIERGEFTACLLGTTPIILNRLSLKARQELLMPRGRKSEAAKASRLKHHPLEEYRDSPYRDKDPKGPTLLQVLSVAIKKATASVALDMPNTDAKKAQLDRLIWTPDQRIPLYGVPQLFMAPVRNSDKNRTPDIRTRAIVPEWACEVRMTFVQPMLRQDTVIQLLATAGFLRGICDWRQEKGSMNYGSWELVKPDDPRFVAIKKTGGREAQVAAMESPDLYDDETAELYAWWNEEVQRRGFKSGGNGQQPVVMS